MLKKEKCRISEKKLLSILAVLFIYASAFSQVKLKPILLKFELENGYNAKVSVWLDDKRISKYFVTKSGNSLKKFDSVYCKNGFNAIKFEVDGKENINRYKNVKYDSLLNIKVGSAYFSNLITNKSSLQKAKNED